MKDNRTSEQVVDDFMKGRMMREMLAPYRRRRQIENLKAAGIILIGIIFILGIIWYGIWFYSQPLDSQIEMRCRNGDSVACLSLPRGE